jgi:hypothetical protein
MTANMSSGRCLTLTDISVTGNARDAPSVPACAASATERGNAMNIRIFQIDRERDTHKVKLLDSSQACRIWNDFKVDPGIYDEVFRGDVRCGSLEDVFAEFNQDQLHPLHRGHSLSVSDVVLIRGSPDEEDGAYYCENIGFSKTDFDPVLAGKQDGLIRVVVLEPSMPAYESDLANDLRSMQRAVSGLIEFTYPFDEKVLVIGNDSAKIDGMEGNRKIDGELYAGPLIITGCGESAEGGICTSLSDEQAADYIEMFGEPEHYTQEEVEESCRIVFISF